MMCKLKTKNKKPQQWLLSIKVVLLAYLQEGRRE